MKRSIKIKVFITIFAAFALLSCSKDSYTEISHTKDERLIMSEYSEHRTYEEALVIAQDAIGMLENSVSTRSAKSRTVNTSDVEYILNISETRSANSIDTLMYVFNYDDNAGFAVVSANRATEELIAVAEYGNYTFGEETENEGFNMFMDMAVDYIASSNGGASKALKDPIELIEYKVVSTKHVLTNYGPFVQVQWGQRSPYNNCCFDANGNQAVAGCVATAIAQVLSYYKHPSSIQITYDATSYTQSLNWNEIITHVNSASCNTCSTHSNQIAKLFRQIGEIVEMNYGVTSSGAFAYKISRVFDEFGYSHGYYQNYNTSIATNSLSQNQIILMIGDNGEVGHAWVLDGYQDVRIDNTEYTRPLGTINWIEGETHSSYASYNHLNWGWNGTCNGYYLTSVFDTQECIELDEGVSSGPSYDFGSNLKMYPYISVNQQNK